MQNENRYVHKTNAQFFDDTLARNNSVQTPRSILMNNRAHIDYLIITNSTIPGPIKSTVWRRLKEINTIYSSEKKLYYINKLVFFCT